MTFAERDALVYDVHRHTGLPFCFHCDEATGNSHWCRRCGRDPRPLALLKRVLMHICPGDVHTWYLVDQIHTRLYYEQHAGERFVK